MYCTQCGKKQENGVLFCENCGTKYAVSEPVEEAPAEQTAPVEPVVAAQTSKPQPVVNNVPPYQIQQPYVMPTQPAIPMDHKPLSPWAYFGYQLLFAIPVVGFILLIVYSFDNSNLNLRNFARSYWCAALIGVAVGVLCLILALAVGITATM